MATTILPTPQKLLDDLFKIGKLGKRSPPALTENQHYFYIDESERQQYIQSLVAQGANPTSNILKANYVGTLREIEILIGCGADVNYHKPDGHSPLTYCIVRNKPKQIKLLQKHNVNIKIEFNGLTPLLMSLVYNKEKLANTDAFKDIFSINNYPENQFLHKAAEKSLIIQILEKPKGREILLHYLTNTNYNPFAKDHNNLNFFEEYKKNFRTSPQFNHHYNFMTDLEIISTKKQLENSIPQNNQQKSILKI